MDDREHAELAAASAILQYLLAERKPAHDNTSDPAWRKVFEDTMYFAERFGAVYARTRRD